MLPSIQRIGKYVLAFRETSAKMWRGSMTEAKLDWEGSLKKQHKSRSQIFALNSEGIG